MVKTKHAFKVSSAVKSLLGKDLVTNKYVAVLELVKNSYDAGASDVWVVFEHDDKKGRVHKMKVIDNGSGMNEEDILERWLALGYSEKNEGMSHDYSDFRSKGVANRTMAGQKGIGRLSCDTLGAALKMTTTTNDGESSYVFPVNWNLFDKDPKIEFQSIELELETTPKQPIKLPDDRDSANGTILEITELRDEWPHKDLERLTQYLQRMVNPYSSEIKDTFNIILIADIFKSVDFDYEKDIKKKEAEGEEAIYRGPRPVNGEIKNTVIDDIKELTTRISCVIEGDKISTSLYDKERLIYTISEHNRFHQLSDCKTDIFFLNTHAKTRFTSRMGVRPVNFGSIYVYKNYFRVLPYGDEGNDWLSLDRQKTQGYARYLSTRDTIGRVSIKDTEGVFREASNREGFIQNEAFAELKEFVTSFAISRLTKFVVGAIKWDRKNAPTQEERRIQSLQLVAELAGSYAGTPPLSMKVGDELLSILEEKMVRDIPDVVSDIESLGKTLREEAKGTAIVERAEALKTAVEHLQSELTASKEQTLFKAKAKSTEEFSKSILHEVKQSTPSIIKALVRVSYALDTAHAPPHVKEDVRFSLLRTKRIEQISKVGSLANFRTTVDKITEDVQRFIRDYITWAADKVTDMRMEPLFDEENKGSKKRFAPLELTIILDNLWSNSYKAAATKVMFSFHNEGDKVAILVSDNGSGVPSENEKRLFTEGFSTRRGSGIGLYTSRYIAQSNKWELDFVGNKEPGQESGACFRLVM